MDIRLCSNAEFARLFGTGNRSIPVHDLLTGLSWHMCFAGVRTDHYDTTPTTQNDMTVMLRAFGGIHEFMGRPMLAEPQPKIYVPMGMHSYMHHIRIGGGNPGTGYPSRNEDPPWTKYGGHVCMYLHNSVGNSGSIDSVNRYARPEAAKRANTPRATGRQMRAACHEAHFIAIEKYGDGKLPEAPRPVIRNGSSGTAVTELQMLLNAHGYIPKLNPDGRFGSLTEASVKWFQTKEKINADGVVGSITWGLLIKTPKEPPQPPVPTPPAPPLTRPVLRRGSNGEIVRELQTLLNKHGASPKLNVDGGFGPLTEAAVRSFQIRQKIGVDGAVGPITWGRLLAV